MPCVPIGDDKRPVTPKGFLDATNDPAEFANLYRRYPGKLIGVRTGEASGIDILDVDPAGLAWLATNEHRMPPTRRHETRRGVHLLFNHVEGFRRRIGIVPGVDVLGDAGFAVWWPATGYTVRGAVVADWPEWLVALVTSKRRLSSERDVDGHLPELETGGLPPAPNTIASEVAIFSRFKKTVPRWSREETFAHYAVTNAMNELMDTREGQRNHVLNAKGYALGRLVARGWIDGGMVVFALGHGAKCCGYVRDHGEAATVAAIRHAVLDGIGRPYGDLRTDVVLTEAVE